DVLFVAVLIAFVKLGDLVHFSPGPGLYVFAGFVLTSLLASVLFDPYCLWEHVSTEDALSEEPSVNPSSPGSASSPGGRSEKASASAGPGDSTAASEPAPRGAFPSKTGNGAKKIPSAAIRPQHKWAWAWMVAPILAAVVAIAAVARSYDDGGLHVSIHFAEGRGLKAGDALLHRGIAVGRVESLVLSHDLTGVDVTVGLTPEAAPLAVQGSRFWVVRPQVDLAGVAGLETVVGAKYLEVLPGPADAPASTTFVGLEEPPLPDLLEPGGLEIVLQAANSTGVRPGTPIFYRQLRVGGVVKVGLASDASAVEARAYIRPEYRSLVRLGTRFWDAGGVRVSGSLTGFSFQVGPLETLVKAGIGMAVPPDAGAEAGDSHRFTLYDRPEAEWLSWRPSLPGQQSGVVGERPPLMRSALDWKESRLGLFTTDRRRFGWTLATPAGLLGPIDMLQPSAKAQANSTVLTLPDRSYALSEPCRPIGRGVGALTIQDLRDVWPRERFRRAGGPEDVYVFGDPAREPLFVSAARLAPGDQSWTLDPAFTVDPSWHGAAVISAADQRTIGVLLLGDDGRFVATPDWDAALGAPPPAVNGNFR
ncbi:MAG TPA: MlaD family protein, partial [Pirellulales bacterium]